MRSILVISFLLLFVQSHAQTINDSLLLYMPFNGNANDESGNNNNGIIHNNVTLTAGREGTPNSAYSFDGINSYIEIPASPSLSKIYSSNEITITAWINIRNWYQGWNVFAVFEQYDPSTDWGAILVEANWAAGGILFEAGYNTNYIGCDYTWSFNTWHNLAVTYNATEGTAKFYVDGILTCTKPYTQNFSPDTVHPFAIGRSLSGPDEYSDGVIDEIRIYNRVLADTEITTLPVNLLSFEGEYKNGISMLHWKTAHETMFSHFEIERSNDGRAFKEIGYVNSKPQTSNDYLFADNNATTELSFYRLKMIDINGQYTYSKVIKLNTVNNEPFNFYPNPAKNSLTVIGLQSGAMLKLLSIDGRLIKQLPTSFYMKVDISGLKKGVYLLEYITDEGVQTKRLIKE